MLLTVDARTRIRGCVCGICGGQSDTEEELKERAKEVGLTLMLKKQKQLWKVGELQREEQ
jgi:hypothetical protein